MTFIWFIFNRTHVDNSDDSVNVFILYNIRILLSSHYYYYNAGHTIRNMGSCWSPSFNEMAQDIWSWAAKDNNWLSVTFIPGIKNATAHAESKEYEPRTWWQLNPAIFKFIAEMVNVTLDMDLLASRVNYQLKPFASLSQYQEASSVDAFTLS